MEEGQCPLCGEKANVEPWQGTLVRGEQGSRFEYVLEGHVECERCGHYDIEGALAEAITLARGGSEQSLTLGLLPREVKEKYFHRLHLLSGLTRNHWARTHKPLRLTLRRLDEQLASAQVPKTPAQCVDKLLLYIRDNSAHFGADVMVRYDKDWPVAFAHGPEEFHNFGRQITKDGHANSLGGQTSEETELRLTMPGWRRAEELERTSAHSTQAFVATWFDSKMDPAYHNGFRLALEDTGWEPLWLKLTKDCGKIDDQITAGIMQGGLVVADFTGHRASVYFEAGFAKGLGVPVILTCRDDDKDSEAAGFDTEHYRHIFWKEPADLRSRLVDFIGSMGLDRTKPLPPRMREEL